MDEKCLNLLQKLAHFKDNKCNSEYAYLKEYIFTTHLGAYTI